MAGGAENTWIGIFFLFLLRKIVWLCKHVTFPHWSLKNFSLQTVNDFKILCGLRTFLYIMVSNVDNMSWVVCYVIVMTRLCSEAVFLGKVQKTNHLNIISHCPQHTVKAKSNILRLMIAFFSNQTRADVDVQRSVESAPTILTRVTLYTVFILIKIKVTSYRAQSRDCMCLWSTQWLIDVVLSYFDRTYSICAI